MVAIVRAALVILALGSLAACAASPRPRAPRLQSPEIVISLRGLTVHVFDRATGFSAVYRARAGKLDATGKSATPLGHFATGPDTSDRWWYMKSRTSPAIYQGDPFLRITAQNHRGEYVYGLHGPVVLPDDAPVPADEDYPSKGCVRLEAADIRELFELVRHHPSTPVTIQEEPELDAAGNAIVATPR
jgi:hypothetical protein